MGIDDYSFMFAMISIFCSVVAIGLIHYGRKRDAKKQEVLKRLRKVCG